MKKFLQWLARSSSNPAEVSMTVRGALIGALPVLLFVGQQLNWGWTEQALTETIQAIASFVSATLILVGMTRKLLLLKK